MKSSYKKEITEEFFNNQRRERALLREEAKADSNLDKIALLITESVELTLEELVRKIIKLKLVTKDTLTDAQLYESTTDLVMNCLFIV